MNNQYKGYRVQKEKSKFKARGQTIFKIIITIFSLCGFIYQVQIIYDQYMSGKTIISIEIGNNQEQTPPAVTICFPQLFSMENAAKFHPDFKVINDKYLEVLKTDFRKVRELHFNSFREYTYKKLKNKGLDMIELFDKMSVKYKALDGNLTILFKFSERTDDKPLQGNFNIEFGKTYRYYTYIGDPLETIVIRQMDKGFQTQECVKCLTFFSHAQEEWRNFQAQIQSINIKYMNPEKSFPFNVYYQISVHSPNHLPSYDLNVDFELIDFTQTTNIKYSENKIQRLGKGYDTDCHSYGSDTNFSYYRMRSDCISDCYQDEMRKICNVNSGLFMSYTLLRKEYIHDENDRLITCYDPAYNPMSLTIKQDCEKMCKPECVIKYYTLQISKHELKRGELFIRHGEFPDIFVRHIPEITLISFICNFGGLLGMWLGLSLFSIFNDSFNMVTKVIYHNNISFNVNFNDTVNRRNLPTSNLIVSHRSPR